MMIALLICGLLAILLLVALDYYGDVTDRRGAPICDGCDQPLITAYKTLALPGVYCASCLKTVVTAYDSAWFS